MPPVQETYALSQPLGFVGQKVNGEEYNAITRVAEDAAGLAFGVPAVRGANDQGCALLTAANAAKFLGVSVRDVSVRPSAGDKYPQGGNVTILTKGAIFVRVQGAVTPDQAALWDTAAGRFTSAAASGTVIALPEGWEFDSSAASGGIAVLVNRA